MSPLPPLEVSDFLSPAFKRVPTGKAPCLFCGKEVKRPENAAHLHVCHGGGVIVGCAQNAEGCRPGACLGAQPVGPECWRRVKAKLEPYRKGAE